MGGSHSHPPLSVHATRLRFGLAQNLMGLTTPDFRQPDRRSSSFISLLKFTLPPCALTSDLLVCCIHRNAPPYYRLDLEEHYEDPSTNCAASWTNPNTCLTLPHESCANLYKSVASATVRPSFYFVFSFLFQRFLSFFPFFNPFLCFLRYHGFGSGTDLLG